MIRLTPAGRSMLWIGGGALAGLAVGALLTNAARASVFLPLWLVVCVLYVGGVVLVLREKGAPAGAPAPRAPAAADAAAPAPAGGGSQRLAVDVVLEEVPEGFPAVLGENEPVQVLVRATRDGGEPADGATVRLEALLDGRRVQEEARAGADGAVEFVLHPQGLGELTLRAHATIGEAAGRADASLSIVRYADEIERLFAEFRAYASSLLGPASAADTARELADKLRSRGVGPDAGRALLELARVYEVVAYGSREADRRAYLAVVEQLLVLEHAELPAPPAPSAAAARGL